MKRWILSLAALAIAAGPALAQQTGTTGTQKQDQAQGAQKQDQAQAADQVTVRAMSQDRLRKSLEKAGFTEIKIVDAAYLVHARTDEGNFVVMWVDPPPAIAQPGGAAMEQTGTGQTTGATQQEQQQ